LTSPFFFRWPPPKLKRFAVWPRELRLLFPNDLRDHSVHQRERCKSAESRINLLPGTLPRYRSVDETRDWSRHSNTKNDLFFELAMTT
jgi:hypothetical protein